jgi:hypothetical protein
MKTRWTALIALACLAFVMCPDHASALQLKPGSCLLYPYYDTTPNSMTVISTTNVGNTDVWVRFVWIDDETCDPYEHWYPLIANDTYTFMTKAVKPYNNRGFMYAYVVENFYSDLEVDADVLIGQATVFTVWDGNLSHFSMNASSFQCLGPPTKDGKLHLNGNEYTGAPKEIYFPRFFGQSSLFKSKLILINLTGGKYFTAAVSMLIFNDNGVPFSQTFNIDCWDMENLEDISGVFSNAFLLGTAHSSNEPFGFSNVVETGTLRVKGLSAWNPDNLYTIDDPSLYGALIECLSGLGFGTADLPFQVEDLQHYHNAMLWSTDPYGN